MRNLDPKPPLQRYQWEQPGDMIHLDIKQLARVNRVGHRITGDPRRGNTPGAGYEKVHGAVGDATRLSYVEVLADEKGPMLCQGQAAQSDPCWANHCRCHHLHHPGILQIE